MIRSMLVVVALSGGVSALAQPFHPAHAVNYDPMADLVSSAKKEINAQAAIDSAKKRARDDSRLPKLRDGHWVFLQGRGDAKPGEGCVAVFWKADQMISIVGPGAGYAGALLTFIAIEPKESFPRPDHASATQKVVVTLTQGRDAPARVTALNRTIGGLADELIFAVPTIDAALAGMEDKLAFRIDHQGTQVFALEWHSGNAARAVLKRCLDGERTHGLEVP